MADPDFNKLLVEECAKAIWAADPDTAAHDATSGDWEGFYEEFPAWAEKYRTLARACLARACLARAAELTFGKIKSDIEPKVTAQALKAAADPEGWRP